MLDPMSEPAVQPPSVVVALDGPASSGKSSVGAAAAERLGMRFVDTGLIYRALTALALRDGVASDDTAALVARIPGIGLEDDGSGRLTRVLLDGMDATDAVRSHEVDAAVSAIARQPEVRLALLDRQRALAAAGSIVVAGRDIGTVVLPGAGLKVYLDASVDERAGRRIAERGLDPAGLEAEAVRAQLRARDAVDSGRDVAPLRVAEDAVVVRTDGNTFDETVELLVGLIRAASAPRPDPGAATGDRPVDAGPAARAAGAEAGDPAGRPAPRASGTGGSSSPRRSAVLERAMRLDNDKTLLVKAVGLISRTIGRLFADVQVEGLDRVPRTGAVILAANHASNADAVVSGAWVTKALVRRRIHWLGKKELFDWPVFGWICARGGVHPVDRSTADVEAYRLATRILEAGFVLLIFPEGTRSPTGALQEAKDGMAQLALRTGARILPIGINDSDRVWPKGRKLPSPWPRRRVTVRIGEPFRVADIVPAGTDRRAAKTAATTAIMGRIAELLEPRQRGFYAEAIRPPAPPEP
jgi:cytidylate kinase